MARLTFKPFLPVHSSIGCTERGCDKDQQFVFFCKWPIIYFSEVNREKSKEYEMPIVKERGNKSRVLVAFMCFPQFRYMRIT